MSPEKFTPSTTGDTYPEDLIPARDQLLAEGAARQEDGTYDDLDAMLDEVAVDPVALRAFLAAETSQN